MFEIIYFVLSIHSTSGEVERVSNVYKVVYALPSLELGNERESYGFKVHEYHQIQHSLTRYLILSKSFLKKDQIFLPLSSISQILQTIS